VAMMAMMQFIPALVVRLPAPRAPTPRLAIASVVDNTAIASVAESAITFESISTPANYSALIAGAEPSDISVVRFQAPYCRSCKERSPLLDRIAENNPQAKFYSLDLVRNGKAAGERMAKLFKQRGVSAMPYVEVWLGATLVESSVEPLLDGQHSCIFQPLSIECEPAAVGDAVSGSAALPRALHRLRQ
jgi:thiol-disulfide isomerase/thioredoxin